MPRCGLKGLEDILLASVDNPMGFVDANAASYSRTHMELCVVRQSRNPKQ